MKNTFLLVLALVIAGCNTTEKEGVKLTGNVEVFPEGGIATVEVITEDGVVPFDTLEVDRNGNFSEVLAIENPEFFRLNFNGTQIITMILTGQEQEVVVNAQGNDPRGFFEVSGSYDTDYKNQIDNLMQSYREKIQVFQQAQRQARASNDVSAFQTSQAQMVDLARRTQGEIKVLIRDAVPSLAAYYGLQMIDANENLAFSDSIATALQASIPESFHVQQLVSQVSTKKRLAIGNEAPEISLETPAGEMVSLSSLRGKYVLLDFWAAWCRPCRAENPNLVRAYSKYSGQNFEILQVSLDKTRDKWVQAIEQDGLPWLHISDLKFWRSEAAIDYQVNAIPASFLIDPEGKIIAKNLRGVQLEAKLKEIFG